jgi:ElaB/YqjD/DUF883 family membrane-anchored ribosome-binding protein
MEGLVSKPERNRALRRALNRHDFDRTRRVEEKYAMAEYQNYGGRLHEAADTTKSYTEELKDNAARAGEYVSEQARAAADETGRIAGEIAAAARERPYTTIAVAAGLAFALGALWKMRSGRQQSNLDALLARLPDMPSRSSLLPRSWR